MGFFGDFWDMGTKNTNFDGYAPFGAAKQVGSDIVNSAKSPGYDTAAAGAKEAQAYLQQLSQLAWDRQMQGLQGALGSFQNYDALSKQLIPSHAGAGGAPAMPGGGQSGGPSGPPSGPTMTGGTGYISPRTATSVPTLPKTGGTGYISPRTPTSIPSNAPPELPPPGSLAPPPLPPPGAPPPLPPPGGLPGAPPPLPPPGGVPGAPPSLAPPDIMTMLAAMTRSGRGHF